MSLKESCKNKYFMLLNDNFSLENAFFLVYWNVDSSVKCSLYSWLAKNNIITLLSDTLGSNL